MIVAGVVIETVPGRVVEVAARLAAEEGVKLEGGDGSRRLAAVVHAEDGEKLESWAQDLVRADEAVLGVFPTFVGADRG